MADPTDMIKKLYIETVGCQMNVLDSELVVAALRKRGYELTDNTRDADTVLFNTCSVREHAEEKVYSALGRLKNAKLANPEKIIGVIGCMAQNHQRVVFSRAPYVDLVVGPGQLHQVPDLIEKIAGGGGQQMEVSLDRKGGTRDAVERSHESFDPLRDPSMRLSVPTLGAGSRVTKLAIGTDPCDVSTRNSSSVDSVRRSSGRRRRISTASSTPAGR